jgi:hypothetical protein
MPRIREVRAVGRITNRAFGAFAGAAALALSIAAVAHAQQAQSGSALTAGAQIAGSPAAKRREELLVLQVPAPTAAPAAFAPSTALQADRWVSIGGSASAYREYVDKQSISRNGDKATLWTRSESALGEETAWKEMEFDCSVRMHTILAYIRDDRGTITHNVDRPHQKSSPVQPASVEERNFNLVCR